MFGFIKGKDIGQEQEVKKEGGNKILQLEKSDHF